MNVNNFQTVPRIILKKIGGEPQAPFHLYFLRVLVRNSYTVKMSPKSVLATPLSSLKSKKKKKTKQNKTKICVPLF